MVLKRFHANSQTNQPQMMTTLNHIYDQQEETTLCNSGTHTLAGMNFFNSPQIFTARYYDILQIRKQFIIKLFYQRKRMYICMNLAHLFWHLLFSLRVHNLLAREVKTQFRCCKIEKLLVIYCLLRAGLLMREAKSNKLSVMHCIGNVPLVYRRSLA